MSKGKTLILFNYLSLLSWWIILTLLKSKTGLGNSFFNLGMGVYVLILSLGLFVSVYKQESALPSRVPVLISSLGMSLFGIGTILWFYYNVVFKIEIPFPSLSDIFYVLQFPFTIFGLLYLNNNISYVSRQRDHNSVLFLILKSLLFIVFVLAEVFLASFISFDEKADLESWLLFYFPIESFFVLLFCLFLFTKFSKSWQKTFVNGFIFVILGYATWFIADSFFFYQIATNTFFHASYPDLLYLTGSFLLMWGLISIIEGSKSEGFISVDGNIYFQKMTYYNPISLN